MMLTSTPSGNDSAAWDAEAVTHQSSNNGSVNITVSVPASIAAMSDLTISLSPRPVRVRSTATQPQQQRSMTPPQSPVMRPRQHRPAPPSTPPSSPARLPGQQTPTLPYVPLTALVHSPASQLEPIYPLRPGRHLRHQYLLSQDRAHGYYIVFRGPKLGIFYTYWYDTSILRELS